LDAQGDRVVAAPRATWDRNLWQVLFERPRYGTLTLDRAALDVERDERGSVDLYETLRPILGGSPQTDLTVRGVGGSLRVRGHGPGEPVAADRADLTIRIPPAPGLVSWQVALADGPPAGAAQLSVEGSLDRWKAPPDRPADLSLSLSGRRWPLALEIR